MRKNHASLTAALAAGVMMLNAAGSCADDIPTRPVPPAQPVASAPAPATTVPLVPLHLAWDRVGIAAFGIGA